MRQILVVLCVVSPSLALAQSGEIWFNAGASILSNKGLGTLQASGGQKDDVSLTDGFRFGFRFTFNSQSIFGHEVGYAYNRTHLRISNPPPAQEAGMAIHQGTYNFLIYGTREGSRIRPFATGGVGFSNYVPPGASAASGGGSTKFGVNYGAGIKMKVSPMFALRFDLREYQTPKPFDLPLKSGWLRQTEASAGFGVIF